DRGRGPVQEIYLAAFIDAVSAYGDALDRCGVVERDRADLIGDPPLPADWLAPGEGDGGVHAHAGVVPPRAVIDAWVMQAEVRLRSVVAALEARAPGWRLRNAAGEALADVDAVVLANGAALNTFAQTEWLDVRLTAGQIEHGPCAAPPTRALLGESYVAPFA